MCLAQIQCIIQKQQQSKQNCTDYYQKKRRGCDHIISAAKPFVNYVLSKVSTKSITRELFLACISFFPFVFGYWYWYLQFDSSYFLLSAYFAFNISFKFFAFWYGTPIEMADGEVQSVHKFVGYRRDYSIFFRSMVLLFFLNLIFDIHKLSNSNMNTAQFGQKKKNDYFIICSES